LHEAKEAWRKKKDFITEDLTSGQERTKIHFMKKIIFLCTLLLSFTALAEVGLNDLLDKMDRLYKSDSSKAVITMKIETPNWTRTLEMEMWSQGLEKTFVTIMAPNKDKGISTLKRDNEMWNYFPKIGRVIKVPPSMMMGSWMGSDFTNDDLVKENTLRDDFTSTWGHNTKDTYHIILIPKPESVTVWGKVELFVLKINLLPVSQVFYDERGEKVRIMNFKDIKKLGGKLIPVTMELIPLKKSGHKTIVTYVSADFGIKLDDSLFTLSNLKKRR